MNMKNPAVLAVGAFLAAWASTNFDVDYRAILWAVLSGVFGYASPKKWAKTISLLFTLQAWQ